MQKMNTRMNTHQISHQIFFFLAFLACLSVLLMTPYSAYSAYKKNKAKLRIGIGPYYSTEQLRKDAHPLVVYLSKKLDRDIQLTITTSYKALAQEVKRGNIDIGFLNAAPLCSVKAGISPVKIPCHLTDNAERKKNTRVFQLDHCQKRFWHNKGEASPGKKFCLYQP
ncbi:hypothetical protein GKODMF_01570 [Candidatus Electrothrix gigas]